MRRIGNHASHQDTGVYPGKLFRPYVWWEHFGRDAPETFREACHVHDDDDCDKDEALTIKACKAAGSPAGLLYGAPAECLHSCVVHGEANETNDDLERDQSWNRHENWSRSCKSVSTVVRSGPLRRIKLEHLKRAGRMDHSLTKADVVKSQVATRAKKNK